MRRMKLIKVRVNRPFGGTYGTSELKILAGSYWVLAMDSQNVFNATIDAQCAKISLIIVPIFVLFRIMIIGHLNSFNGSGRSNKSFRLK